MLKIVREAYIYGCHRPGRTEPDWPNYVVNLVHAIPYSGNVLMNGIDGRFLVRENEECPFKNGDIVKVTIELKKRKDDNA